MHRFKKLEIWKRSRTLCFEIYSVTQTFPESEKFGLTNQLRRAAVSIASNIAEGSSRSSVRDFSRFLEIANGSAFEIETQLLIAMDLHFLSEAKLETLSNELEELVRMISRFRSNLINP